MRPVLDWEDFVLWNGDCRDVFAHMAPKQIQTIVTSPPYWGMRDYGTSKWNPPFDLNYPWERDWRECDHEAARKKTRYDYSLDSSPIQDGSRTGTDAHAAMWMDACPSCGSIREDGQIGLEKTPAQYVRELAEVFSGARRVLRDDCTIWVNLGDKYIDGALQMIPAEFAAEMRFRGWKLINDVIWCKPNVMPESATRRFTKAHEHILVFAQSDEYRWFQQFEDAKIDRYVTWVQKGNNSIQPRAGDRWPHGEKRNMRDWWAIPPANYADQHFAVFPDEIPARAIAASTTVLDWVLDPFMGSGTTGRVARAMDRRAVGIELNEAYCEQIVRNNAQQTLWTGEA